jgi:hypothetical protein
MANLVYANDILRATVKLAHPVGSLIENVWHFRADGSGSANPADVLDTIEGFMTLVYNAWDAIMHEDTTWVDCLVCILQFAVNKWLTTADVGSIPILPDFTPASAQDVLPPATAHMLRYRTDTPKHEGRKFFAPFTEYYNTDGEPTQAVIDIGNIVFLNTLLWAEEIPDSSLTLQAIVLDVDQEIYRFSGAGIQHSRWAQQRRRKKYVGI